MPPDEVIELEDDAVITVDLEATPGETPVEPIVEKPTIPRTRQQKSTADDAAAALAQAIKATETETKAREQAESSRRAAEATAMAERQRAEAAQRLADQRGQEAKSYRDEAQSTRLVIIQTGIENATREVAAYEAELTRAFEAGEAAKLASAQVKLSKASAALDRLEADKVSFEANVARGGAAEGRVEAPIVTEPPFEQYVKGFAPVAQAWLRQHPECVPAYAGGNPLANAKMMLGHETAVNKGIPQGSDAYFQTIEEHTGHRQPVVAAVKEPVSTAADVIEAEPARQTRQTRVAATPSAPVTRDPPSARTGESTTRQSVTLTPQQQEIALLATEPRKTYSPNGQVIAVESDADYRKRALAQYAKEVVAMRTDPRFAHSRDIHG